MNRTNKQTEQRMKAKELAAVSGKTVVAIRGAYYRFYDTKTGWSIAKELGDEFVNHVLKSSSDDTPKPKPNRKTEPKAEPQKEVQTEPENKPDSEPEPNRTKSEEPEPQTEPKPDVKQAEPNQPEPFDLGELVFFHPSAKFIYVFILILGQAWVFASLAERVYEKEENHLPFMALFVFGVIVEFGGIMLSKVFGRSVGGDTEVANVWLFAFLVWQIAVDMSYFKLFGSWSDSIGQYVIAISLPLGILVYSVIYFKGKFNGITVRS